MMQQRGGPPQVPAQCPPEPACGDRFWCSWSSSHRARDWLLLATSPAAACAPTRSLGKMLRQAGKPCHSLGNHRCAALGFKQVFSPLLIDVRVLSSPSAFHFEIWFWLTLKCKGNNLG